MMAEIKAKKGSKAWSSAQKEKQAKRNYSWKRDTSLNVTIIWVES